VYFYSLVIEMRQRLTIISLIFATLSILLINNPHYDTIWAQENDKSFKGDIAPFVPPPATERGPQTPPSDAISVRDLPPTDEAKEEVLDQEQAAIEGERDPLPPLTEREFQEFVFDNETDQTKSLTIIPNATSFEDPIKSVVEEIIKNESIISDDAGTVAFNTSNIKFEKQRLDQLFNAQQAATDVTNETLTTLPGGPTGANVTGVPVNATEETDEEDVISETETPDTQVLEFVNQTVINASKPIPSSVPGAAIQEQPLEEIPGEIVPPISNETTAGAPVGTTMPKEEVPINKTVSEAVTESEQTTKEIVPPISNETTAGEPAGTTMPTEEVPINETVSEAVTESEQTTDGMGQTQPSEVPQEITPSVKVPSAMENQTSLGNETTGTMEETAGEEPPIAEVEGDVVAEEKQQQAKGDQEEQQVDEEEQQQAKEGISAQGKIGEGQLAPQEICGDEQDNDLDGLIDEKECTELQGQEKKQVNEEEQQLAQEEQQQAKDDQEEEEQVDEEDQTKEDKKKSQVEPVEICEDEIDNDVDGLVDEFECVPTQDNEDESSDDNSDNEE